MPTRIATADRQGRVAYWLMAATFISATIAIAVVLFAIVQTRGAALEADNSRALSAMIVSDAEALAQGMADAETAERGYALTRRPSYQETYQRGLQVAADAEANLRRLARDTPDIRAAIEEALVFKARVLDSIQRNVGPITHGQMRTAMLFDERRARMDELRAATNALRDKAEAREFGKAQEAASARNRVDYLIAGLIFLFLLTSAVTAFLLVREARTLKATAIDLDRARTEALAARARAEEADAAKTRFLAMASHDMRQPLHALTLYLASLKRRVEAAQAKDIVVNMEKAAESLTRMFSGLLDLARIEAGVLTPVFKTESVADLFDGLERELRNDCERERVELIIAPTGLHVRTDPELMKSILRNLLTNAIKYASRGRVLLGCRRSGDSVRIEVHDEGQGIPEEKLVLMFGEFVRLEQSGAAKEGLGLGLSIASQLAKLLGAELGVSSRVGKGTVFWISAPLAEAERRPEIVPPVGRNNLTGLRVAVLDDEPDSLAAMLRVLEDAGGEPKGYGQAERYIAAIRAGETFDLIIADPVLRNQAQAELDGAAQTPTIVVTGSTDAGTLSRLQQSGAAWVVKPIPEEQLLALAARTARPG